MRTANVINVLRLVLEAYVNSSHKSSLSCRTLYSQTIFLNSPACEEPFSVNFTTYEFPYISFMKKFKILFCLRAPQFHTPSLLSFLTIFSFHCSRSICKPHYVKVLFFVFRLQLEGLLHLELLVLTLSLITCELTHLLR